MTHIRLTHPTDRMTIARIGDREFRIAHPAHGERFTDAQIRQAVRERIS
ncbi:hypothetical protein [Sphingomonas oryzagri]|uniref:Uncharacterized protein n=1 Tax=Sphingomonas oryzagri TaxID=3042314 RepID=A0ABT6N2E8_9SPHN|nr:hypothetical protein [Sphingomonas oryzagri]MDH7638944.1 hypothetical protein [Sphingomonas oryzagri]